MRFLSGILLLPMLAGAQGITMRERLGITVEDTVGPLALFTSSAGAGIQHWRDVPPEWGQGMEGFGRRLGYHIAGNAAGNAMELAAGVALHEDPRYTPAGGRGIWRRVRYSIVHTFRVQDSRGGGTRFGYARLIGAYGSGFLSNAWYPQSASSTGEALLRGSYTVAADLGGKVFQEFWPDLKRLIFKR